MARCLHCLDTGHVCENHPAMPWEGLAGVTEGHADCGGAGMPCGYCCSPVPEDGQHSIGEAFTPDWQRELQEAAEAAYRGETVDPRRSAPGPLRRAVPGGGSVGG